MGGGASKEDKYVDSTSTTTQESRSVLDNTDDEEAPDFLTCPLSYEVMRDPVFTADGHTFERHVIEEWLRDHDTNPMTNSTMPHKQLTPNFAIREACAAYRQQNPSNAESIKRYQAAVAKVKQLPAAATTASTNEQKTSSSSSSSSFLANSTPPPQPTESSGRSRHSSGTTGVTTKRSFDFADYDRSPTNATATPTRSTTYNYGEYHPGATPSSTTSNYSNASNYSNYSNTSNTSNTSNMGSNGIQCSLCTNSATTKSKIGPNEWIKVCEGCSKVVAAQRSKTSSPSSARFRSVSATEAAEQALTASMSPTSSGVVSRHGPGRSHLRSVSVTSTTTPTSTTAPSPTMACAHCRQQAICQRATDIDGTQLWLCPGCGDTQRQFSQAHAAASPINNANHIARTSPINRRQTWSPQYGEEQHQTERVHQYSTHANERILHLNTALGSSSSSDNTPIVSPSQACHNRAWDRAEAMAALEQHEWSRANAASANEMADQITDRYANTLQRGARSPVARRTTTTTTNNVAQQPQHPANCPCGLCARR